MFWGVGLKHVPIVSVVCVRGVPWYDIGKLVIASHLCRSAEPSLVAEAFARVTLNFPTMVARVLRVTCLATVETSLLRCG